MAQRRRQQALIEVKAEESFLHEPLLPEDSRDNVVVVHETDASHTHARQQDEQSRNIPIALTYTVLMFAGRSLWSGSVLSTFVYLLKHDNAEAVGFLTAVMGMSQLAVSVPTGVWVDRYRRDAVLHLASAVGIKAVILTLFAIWRASYLCLILALAVYGAFWGLANTSLSALFADSIRNGDRSYYFTKRSILINIGNTMGPLVALVLFVYLGDRWTVKDCAIVMFVGQILCVPGMCLLCWLSDDHAVLQTDEHGAETSDERSVRSHPHEILANTDELGSSHAQDDRSVLLGGFISNDRIIPICIAMADVTSGLGSGMSIRYFPIFFLDNLHLSPVVVQLLYAVAPLGQASLMHIGQLLARRIGRCRMTVVYKWIGVTCMLAMIVSYVSHMPHWFICMWYLIRTSFMNATSALTKSVLMDAVPKHERGKWSSLESVNMFSWSGSAAVGGLLVGYKGILFNFCVTAGIQLLATLPLMLLFEREPREEEAAVVVQSGTKAPLPNRATRDDK